MTQLSKVLLYFGLLSILMYINQRNIMASIVTKTFFKTYKLECDLNPEYVDNLTCQLKAISFTRGVINFRCDLKIPIRNLSFNAALYKMYSEFRPYYFNYTMNACDLVDRKASVFYAKAIYKLLKPISNLNHSCPYKGSIIVDNWELKDTYIPMGLAMPLGKFKTAIKFTEGYPPVDLGSIAVYVDAFEKRIRTNS